MLEGRRSTRDQMFWDIRPWPRLRRIVGCQDRAAAPIAGAVVLKIIQTVSQGSFGGTVEAILNTVCPGVSLVELFSQSSYLIHSPIIH